MFEQETEGIWNAFVEQVYSHENSIVNGCLAFVVGLLVPPILYLLALFMEALLVSFVPPQSPTYQYTSSVYLIYKYVQFAVLICASIALMIDKRVGSLRGRLWYAIVFVLGNMTVIVSILGTGSLIGLVSSAIWPIINSLDGLIKTL